MDIWTHLLTIWIPVGFALNFIVGDVHITKNHKKIVFHFLCGPIIWFVLLVIFVINNLIAWLES